MLTETHRANQTCPESHIMSTHVNSRKHNNTHHLTVTSLRFHIQVQICTTSAPFWHSNTLTTEGKRNVSCKNWSSTYRCTHFRSAHLSPAAFSVIQWAHPNPLTAEWNVRHQQKRKKKRTERQRGHNLTFLFSGGGGDRFPPVKSAVTLQVWRGSRFPLRYS